MKKILFIVGLIFTFFLFSSMILLSQNSYRKNEKIITVYDSFTGEKILCVSNDYKYLILEYGSLHIISFKQNYQAHEYYFSGSKFSIIEHRRKELY